ncbi:MAG: DUF362 domain-containing protein [Bacillota bacterium]|jgi:uncharacterized protein (DUF362 family)/Pyruvate/2-oxoacid:ferredoxin oxidoreductase delta subunit
MSKSQVALVKCSSYQHEELTKALQEGFHLLGGIEKFIKKDEQILLKPNLLSADISSKYTTTNAEFFKVIAEALLPYSPHIVYGDSPAAQNMIYVAQRSGIAQAAKNLAVGPADFQNSVSVTCPDNFLRKKYSIAKGVTEADGIFSLCRLKTHGLTKITGAVKNQMGYLPGLLKASFHARMPDLNNFARMLVELNLLYRPRLYIMDAIIAMEGNGPSNGTGKQMSLMLLSEDPVALDATACRLIDLNPQYVMTNVWGEKVGLGYWNENNIEILGEKLEDFVDKDFKVNRQSISPAAWISLLSSAGRIFMNKPYIDKKICTNCGFCIEICPVKPKALSRQASAPVYNYHKCIRCFCCQELCPQGAIKIKSPFIPRLFRR